MGISQTTVILGHTWLMEHNPDIYWCMGDIHMTRCLATCRSVTNTDSPSNSVYCITPALDGYISLLERTPHTWMMMTQYMWHSPLQSMASSFSSVTITSIQPFCFCPDCFHQS